MLQIAICDDQPLHGELSAKAVTDCVRDREVRLRVFEHPETLLCEIRQAGYSPRIAILDIQMEGMDGIDLAKQLNSLCPSCAIIFLTAFLEYATDIYDTEHVYFIVKSELKERIGAAIEKALRTEPVKSSLLYYRADASVQAIPAAEVLYMERCLRKTRLQTGKGTLWTSSTPGALLNGEIARCFIRCHHSYWVNFWHIQAMRADHFVLYDGSSIPITRTYRAAAKEQFFGCIRMTTAKRASPAL